MKRVFFQVRAEFLDIYIKFLLQRAKLYDFPLTGQTASNIQNEEVRKHAHY
jgi:hypothetical protein